MKRNSTGRAGRRRKGSTRFFLSAVAIAVIIFVVVMVIQRWHPWGGEKAAKSEAPVTATTLMPTSGESLAGFELVLTRCRHSTSCPYYLLSAKQDTLEYLGVRGVLKQGKVDEPLTVQRKRKLLALVRKAAFFGLADSYGLSDSGCKAKRTDAPTLTIGVKLNGKTKIVRANKACSNVPTRLIALAHSIDRVSGSARWTGVGPLAPATAR